MEEKKELIQNIFRLVKKNICRIAPFLYQVCAMICFIPGGELKEVENTCGEKHALSTDGINIYYDEDQIMELYKERRLIQVEKEMLHILLHGMLGHFAIWKSVDNQNIFDLCADREVES